MEEYAEGLKLRGKSVVVEAEEMLLREKFQGLGDDVIMGLDGPATITDVNGKIIAWSLPNIILQSAMVCYSTAETVFV